jgi:hypothetical protein
MNKQEIVDRNIELAKKRILHVLEHPEDAPPNGAHVIELPRDDPELLEANLALAVRLAHKIALGEETGAVVMLPEVDGFASDKEP